MGGVRFSFRRYEKKYLITLEQYEKLLPVLLSHMEPDCFAEDSVRNIYFDTLQYDLIRASIEKPAYKEKLRLRSYGPPTEDSMVFLELKKKYMGIVYKRRVGMTLQEAERYLSGEERPKSVPEAQLAEFDVFLERYPLRRRLLLTYHRMALVDCESPELRITFDREIRWNADGASLGEEPTGEELLPDHILMEVKIPGTMPLWLAKLLSQNHVWAQSFSKYGTVYQRALLPKMQQETIGGVYAV